MANLFWKTKTETKSLLSTPFKTEEEFEKLIFDTPEILEDIFLLKRQIRGGNKTGIPDIVGIDNDGNICIIEMKNIAVDASIIPQVLHYAFWAETNPDSIKALWLELEEKPEDLNISWDSFQVRIIVIAPSILRSTLDIVDKINYPVDLIEVKRWVESDNSLFLVNKLDAEPKIKRPKTTTGLQEYDEEFYKKEFNKKSAIHFLKYSKSLEEFTQKKGWELELKYNKHYCSFKAGFFNAYGIQWMGSKTFAFFFKLSEEEIKETGIEITKYEPQWKQGYYYIDPAKTKIEDCEILFTKAFQKIAGN
jgi:hypothetical protein